jgi:hypothetical protein
MAAASLLVLFLLLWTVVGFERFPKRQIKTEAKKVVAKLNTDGLPGLKEILEEIEMEEYLMKFARMGITETRLLLRMSEMDYTMMSIDWEEIKSEQINKIKAVVKKYYDLAAEAALKEVSQEADPNVAERQKLKYGKIYLPGAVQSFEYVQASFGGPAPLGSFSLEMSPFPHTGCSPAFYRSMHTELERTAANGKGEVADEEVGRDGEVAVQEEGGQQESEDDEAGVDLTGKAYVVKRGHCSFLAKAQYAFKHNASALIIVNSENRLEAPSSGYGIDPRISSENVTRLGSLPIFSVSNGSWAKLDFSLRHGYQWSENSGSVSAVHAGSTAEHQKQAKHNDVDVPRVRFVPLKCGEQLAGSSTKSCVPVLKEEKRLNAEISWGTMRITSHGGDDGTIRVAKSFQFLTSAAGGILPVDEIKVVRGDPRDGCTDLVNDNEGRDSQSRIRGHKKNVAVALTRGGCSFDEKLLHAEQAGARMGLVMETNDAALQRMGGSVETNSFIGMPSILCSTPCQAYLDNILSNPLNDVVVQLTMGKDSSLADKWLDLVVHPWAEEDDEKALQMEQFLPSFSGDENLEIAHWLRRQANNLRDRPIDVSTDGYDAGENNWE